MVHRVNNVLIKWVMILKIISVSHVHQIVQHVMVKNVYNVRKDFTFLIQEKIV